MALINQMTEGFKEHPSVHQEIEATYYILDFGQGKKALQIDTYGRETRDIPGKVSQTIQFSPQALAQLRDIIKKME